MANGDWLTTFLIRRFAPTVRERELASHHRMLLVTQHSSFEPMSATHRLRMGCAFVARARRTFGSSFGDTNDSRPRSSTHVSRRRSCVYCITVSRGRWLTSTLVPTTRGVCCRMAGTNEHGARDVLGGTSHVRYSASSTPNEPHGVRYGASSERAAGEQQVGRCLRV